MDRYRGGGRSLSLDPVLRPDVAQLSDASIRQLPPISVRNTPVGERSRSGRPRKKVGCGSREGEKNKRRERSRKRTGPPPDDLPSNNGGDVPDSASDNPSAEDGDEPMSASDGDDEEEDLGMFEDVHPWNSEEGFPLLMERADMFYRKVRNHGQVCSICGERKHSGQNVHVTKLLKWLTGSTTVVQEETDRLDRMLYPQYPSKNVPKVGSLY